MDGNMMENLMRGAREFQERMERAREEVKGLRAEGESGGGWVRVVVGGDRRVLRVEIADEAMGDKAMLQDLIASALSDANRKMEEKIAEKMRNAAPSGIPGMPL